MRHSLVTRIVRAYEAREPETDTAAKPPVKRRASRKDGSD